MSLKRTNEETVWVERYAKIKGKAVTPFCINLSGWPLLTAADDQKALFHFQVAALRSPAAPSP